MMQNPRIRRMAVPSISPRKRSHIGLIIGTVVVILFGVGIGLYFFLTSNCQARDEIGDKCSEDDKCCVENKLKCEFEKCCGNIGFKCSNNDECCDLNCEDGSCKKPKVECTKKDNECSANDDCCDDLNCNSDNICADCKLKNVNCSDSNECCNENCSGGKCYEESPPGTPPGTPSPPGTPPGTPTPPGPITCPEGYSLVSGECRIKCGGTNGPAQGATCVGVTNPFETNVHTASSNCCTACNGFKCCGHACAGRGHGCDGDGCNCSTAYGDNMLKCNGKWVDHGNRKRLYRGTWQKVEDWSP